VLASDIVTIAGTAQPGSSVELFDWLLPVGKATADPAGAWRITLTSVMGGAHIYSARAIGASGDADLRSATCTLTVDLDTADDRSSAQLRARRWLERAGGKRDRRRADEVEGLSPSPAEAVAEEKAASAAALSDSVNGDVSEVEVAGTAPSVQESAEETDGEPASPEIAPAAKVASQQPVPTSTEEVAGYATTQSAARDNVELETDSSAGVALDVVPADEVRADPSPERSVQLEPAAPETVYASREYGAVGTSDTVPPARALPSLSPRDVGLPRTFQQVSRPPAQRDPILSGPIGSQRITSVTRQPDTTAAEPGEKPPLLEQYARPSAPAEQRRRAARARRRSRRIRLWLVVLIVVVAAIGLVGVLVIFH
jgi:hypothetical protein